MFDVCFFMIYDHQVDVIFLKMSKIRMLLEGLKEDEREYERLKGYVNVKRYNACIDSIKSKRDELKREILLQREKTRRDADAVTQNKNVRCFYCSRLGHYASNCWVKQALQEKERVLKERERLLQRV